MRIIAGKAKGHHLKSLKSNLIRPTSDLVRGAIFSSLESLEADYSRVIDFYAGTGALGIEALSRGADWADFVEQDPRCCAIIRENLEHTKLSEQAHVYCCTVKKALSFLRTQYSLIFLDPPYTEPEISTVLEQLPSSPLIREDTTMVVEHSVRYLPHAGYGNLYLKKKLNHGDTRVSIYQYIEGGLA